MSSGLQVVTTLDRPELGSQAEAAFLGGWPEFIFHDPISKAHIERVEKYFPEFDVLLLDEGEVVAGGWGVPLVWDGSARDLPEGYDGALVRSVEGHEARVAVDTLSIMAAAVRPDHQGKGIASEVLVALRERALRNGLRRVIAPVRPPLKARYPLVPMERFLSWTRGDGLALDPWIRTHQRLGATVLAPALRSMRIQGTVAEWEAWTEMAFPESGQYVVPEALDLVAIDRDADQGEYVEPNVWIRHR